MGDRGDSIPRFCVVSWDWSSLELEARREEREPKPAPLTYEEVEAAAAILAQREPYGLTIEIINPTSRSCSGASLRRSIGTP